MLDEEDHKDVPGHFKSYTIQDRDIFCEKAKRIADTYDDGVYEGPAKVKEVNLAAPGETPKPVFVSVDLSKEEESDLITLLKEYKDCFAWSYEDMKGVPPEVVQHTIPIRDDAKPVQQRPYDMNPKYKTIVKEEIDKLLDAGFIYEIEHTEWVSPIVIVTKKNGKIRVCVDLKKVNAATVRDHYPLPFTEHVLERVAGHEAYSFLDGFSGYNQVSIDPKDQHKTAFATTWGVLAYRKMPFGLTNAPATFQRLMSTAFKEYLRIWLEIFLDDLCIYSRWLEHLKYL